MKIDCILLIDCVSGAHVFLTLRRFSRNPQVARGSLRKLLGGREPVIAALHAGLECGVIGDKASGMDMVWTNFHIWLGRGVFTVGVRGCSGSKATIFSPRYVSLRMLTF